MKKVLGLILTAATVLSCVSFSSINAGAYAITGDLNGDNKISLRDASVAQKIDVGLITPSSDQLKSGDLNNDGAVNIKDSLILQKYVCLDKTTVDMITPNLEERKSLVALINSDREALGLDPLVCTDAHYEAGNIIANEYLSGYTDKRPDGSEFYTVLEQCNLGYNSSATPNIATFTTAIDAEKVYKRITEGYTGDGKLYTQITSSQYNTLCVGSVKKTGTSDQYLWVIIIN